jgi:O-antigen ligase
MYILVIGLVVYLLYLSNSATSLLCLLVAVSILLVGRIPAMMRKPGRIFMFGMVIICVFLVLEATINLSRLIIVDFLGRDPSLTTRVPMWFALIEMSGNPLTGVGYESFWLGQRLEVLWQVYGTLHHAHNGYLEVYLNLGMIGLFLLIATLLTGMVRLQKQMKLKQQYALSILRLTFLVVILIYNWTEASFFGVNNMWLLMFFSVIGLPAWSGARMELHQDKDARPAPQRVEVYAHDL